MTVEEMRGEVSSKIGGALRTLLADKVIPTSIRPCKNSRAPRPEDLAATVQTCLCGVHLGVPLKSKKMLDQALHVPQRKWDLKYQVTVSLSRCCQTSILENLHYDKLVQLWSDASTTQRRGIGSRKFVGPAFDNLLAVVSKEGLTVVKYH